MIIKRLIVLMILISLLPVTVALTDELKKIQDSFENGFTIGFLYYGGHSNVSKAKEYNALAQEHNDYLNETYRGEAKDYLIPFLPMPSAGENETKDKIKDIIGGQTVVSESKLKPIELDATMFVPDINAIQEIQINKVLRPLDDGIRIGRLSGV